MYEEKDPQLDKPTLDLADWPEMLMNHSLEYQCPNGNIFSCNRFVHIICFLIQIPRFLYSTTHRLTAAEKSR